MMRKRPTKENLSEKFIDASPNTNEDKEIKRKSEVLKLRFWPLDNLLPSPQFQEGSKLTKSMSLPLKEFEWNTIDFHVKNLGLKKAEWIRHAIYKLLESEQKILDNNDETNKK